MFYNRKLKTIKFVFVNTRHTRFTIQASQLSSDILATRKYFHFKKIKQLIRTIPYETLNSSRVKTIHILNDVCFGCSSITIQVPSFPEAHNRTIEDAGRCKHRGKSFLRISLK